jgi:hypothetical protein
MMMMFTTAIETYLGGVKSNPHIHSIFPYNPV